ncbi:hypothetical protein AB7849_17410 [Rhodanobacter sp. 115]|uniref:hypothetical protein n=1 Tax=Rhodanobacter sp. FW021-MT20 TaxID=1162282 RepID=UPI0012FAAF11|nr:hypothetical protein [Rhodanobacter sp. 115]
MATTKEVGDGGARRAAALLGIAACGEVSNASMDEDAAKVDLHLTFRNAFRSNELVTLRCQVKSGPSYGRRGKDHITLSIDGDTKDALTGTGTPGLIAWVPPPPLDRVYWFASDPRTKRKAAVKVAFNDYVRPSLRYDLSRLAIYATWAHRHACQTVRKFDEGKILPLAKVDYLRLKSTRLVHPLVGELKVSRFAWRHVTRRSKTAKQRHSALLATRYLHAFLDKVPDRYLCRREAPARSGRRMIETRHVICWYRDALSIDGHPHTLVIRIREIVSYPESWQSHALTVADIKQEATLASWWHTPQK